MLMQVPSPMIIQPLAMDLRMLRGVNSLILSLGRRVMVRGNMGG